MHCQLCSEPYRSDSVSDLHRFVAVKFVTAVHYFISCVQSTGTTYISPLQKQVIQQKSRVGLARCRTFSVVNESVLYGFKNSFMMCFGCQFPLFLPFTEVFMRKYFLKKIKKLLILVRIYVVYFQGVKNKNFWGKGGGS